MELFSFHHITSILIQIKKEIQFIILVLQAYIDLYIYRSDSSPVE